MIEVDDSTEEVDKILVENQLKNLDDLHKSIGLLNARIERTKEKIIASSMADDIVVDEVPMKQPKLNKMVFENDKAMHVFLQNVKKMVRAFFKMLHLLKIRLLYRNKTFSIRNPHGNKGDKIWQSEEQQLVKNACELFLN